MLNSMTGFGSAAAEDHGISCTVEIRSVNNRFLKTVIKLPDKLAGLEPELERTLRQRIARGSLVLTVSVKDALAPTSIAINQSVLKTYVDQIKSLESAFAHSRVDLAMLLNLPGVVQAGEDSAEYLATHQEFVLRLIDQAIAKFGEMRRREGAAIWTDLKIHLDAVKAALGQVAAQAPLVAKTYHEKLKARVNQLVSDARLSLSDSDLLKEVALFADRADISEEIARLRGHLDQFTSVCELPDVPPQAAPHGHAAPSAAGHGGDGRKLDFIAQEMLREANTIASKANDPAIARLTVDIKSAIDRIKEQVQNIE